MANPIAGTRMIEGAMVMCTRGAAMIVLGLACALSVNDARAARRFEIENREWLVSRPNAFVSTVRWNADGTRLAYFENELPLVSPKLGRIRFYDLGADKDYALARDSDQAAAFITGGGTGAGHAFTPDGQYLLFASFFDDPSLAVASLSRAHIDEVAGEPVVNDDEIDRAFLTAADLGAPAGLSVVEPNVIMAADGTAYLSVTVGDIQPPLTLDEASGVYVIKFANDGTLELPGKHVSKLFATGILSPSADEIALTLVNNPCTDTDVYVLSGIQRILDGLDPVVASLMDTRAHPVDPNPGHQAAPSWSSDGSLLYFVEETTGTFNSCGGGAIPIWDIGVAETASVVGGTVGATLSGNAGLVLSAVASPGGTRFAFTDYNSLVVATWRITDDAPVDLAGNTSADFTLDDATGTKLFIPAGTQVSKSVFPCRPCDATAETAGDCSNGCITLDCDDDARTEDLGIGGAGCSQHDGDQPSCELAWHVTDDRVPMSCFYDAGLGECRRCGRAEREAGKCANSCLPCNDPNHLSTQNFAPGPLGCRAFDGNVNQCTNFSHALTDSGVPVSCYYTNLGFCFPCDAEHQNRDHCANVCVYGGHGAPYATPAGNQCEASSKTEAEWVDVDELRQLDGDQAACEGAWYTRESSLPATFYYDTSARVLPVSVFTPISPVAEAQLAGSLGSLPTVRDFGPDGNAFAPAVELSIHYSDAELGDIVEDDMSVSRFDEGSGQYDSTLPLIEHDTGGNLITVALSGFSKYGAGGPLPPHPDRISILGKTLVVKAALPSAADPSKRKFKLMGKETNSPDALVGDPTVDGATLTLSLAGTTLSSQTFTLEAPGWSASGTTGFKYSSKSDPTPEGLAKVGVKRSANGTFLLKMIATSKGGPLAVVPPNTGVAAEAKLSIGSKVYCVALGGGAGGVISKNDAGTFVMKNATTEVACTP